MDKNAPGRPGSRWAERMRRVVRRPSGGTALHLLSLVFVGVVVVVAARGQYFYYDEWDFLASRSEWSLLAPHNGHLSFFPQLLTTVIKGFAGLHSYWPFLLPTLLAHLALVHMVWRVALRSGAAPVMAVLASTTFGVLAAGAENTLWAFQVGFITPLVLGLGAVLLVSREKVTGKALIGVSILMIVALGFASTALPLVAAVILFLAIRHGLRSAVGPALAIGASYGAWYLIFNRGGGASDLGVRPGSLYDLGVVVPQYVFRAFIDSIAKMLPAPDLAPALVIGLLVLLVWVLARSTVRDLNPALVLAFAAVVFAALAAYARARMGFESASSGRYVYVYAALLAPAFAVVASALVRRSRLALGAAVVLGLVLISFNAGNLVKEGRNQSLLERHVERAISAAIALDDNRTATGQRTPSAILAPTLTMDDIREFRARGQLSTVAFTPDDSLDAEVNLFLTADPVTLPSPEIEECQVSENGLVEVDTANDLVWAPTEGTARVTASRGDADTEFALLRLTEGWNEIGGVELDRLLLNQPDAGGLCVVPRAR